MSARCNLAHLAVLSAAYHTLVSTAEAQKDKVKEFFKPPSPCLMGESCRNCVHTLEFYGLPVCCYHCRLNNIVISGDTCHCLDTRLPQSHTDIGGNCSSGQICDNCAVRISSDASQEATETPGTTVYCCQDCGIVMPYLYRDEKGCHCAGDTQGRVHEAVPRYDPTNSIFPTTTTTTTDSGASPVSGLFTLLLWRNCLVSTLLMILLANWS